MAKQRKQKPNVSQTKPKSRTGVAIMLYLDPELDVAFRKFIGEQKFPPTKTLVLETALRRYLEEEGYWPPKEHG